MKGPDSALNATASSTLPPGVELLPDYVSPDDEHNLLSLVDSGVWSTELARRVQHFGYRYDYRKRSVDPSMCLGSLPPMLQAVANRLVEELLFDRPPDQVIVNEYLPGQGIAAHVDCEPCFGPVIASLSLFAPVIIAFANKRTREVVEVDLPHRSLLVLSGEGRYGWTHSIPARKTDMVDGALRQRMRRVSLTFRTMILNPPAR